MARAAWGKVESRTLGGLAFFILLFAIIELGGIGSYQGRHLLASFEGRIGDFLMRQHARKRPPDRDIVIVDIDESSLEKMAPLYGRYPWPRSVHAEIVEGLLARGARAVVFDIVFSDPLLGHEDGDQYLAEVAQANANVFLPIVRLQQGNDAGGVKLAQFGELLGFKPGPNAHPGASLALNLPYPALAATGRLGVINFHEDGDGIGRRYYLYLEHEGWRIPSLPARVVQSLGYPLPEEPEIVLNWRGERLGYPRVSYADLYSDLDRREPQRPADEFRGKIVLIGSTAQGLHDLRATPLHSLHPAVEIVATTIDNLKQGDWLREGHPALPLLLTLVLLLALRYAFRRIGNPLPIGIGMLLLSPATAGTAFAAISGGYTAPLFTPLLLGWIYYMSAAVTAYIQERQTRERTAAMFSRFLDPRVVKQLVDSGENMLSLSGQSRIVTVLFSDIRGFTTLSERSTPEYIVGLLNDYFERQVQVIFRNQGTMDKFIGDAIMAFWGAPVDDPDQAVHAVTAALDMCDTLEAFRKHLGPEGAGFDVGIGIHTGPAVVGFIGSSNRLDYTTIGDTVNLASRIEGQTKGVARVLVSAETRERCLDAFEFIDRGSYKVKGRTQEVRLFEPRRKSA